MYQAARETIVAPTSARPTPAPQSALSSETPRLPGLAPWCRSGTLAKQNARLERRPSRWDCRDRTVLERLTCRQETPAPGCLAGMARLSAYQPRMAFTGTSDNDLGGCGSLDLYEDAPRTPNICGSVNALMHEFGVVMACPELANWATPTHSSIGDADAPIRPIDGHLTSIWQDVLRVCVTKVGTDDNQGVIVVRLHRL